jgi:dethiobiotin synthetase
MALSRKLDSRKQGRDMSVYFVTATGTDIGKTFVTAGLIRFLRGSGRPVEALKPIVSGFDPARPDGSDPSVLLGALGVGVSPESLERISPWRFADALSPDMAAARAGQTIAFEPLIAFCRRAIALHRGTLFIEGVGGVMVPLNDGHTVLDWIAELGFPAIVVAGSYLGTISHTLTALDALKRRDIKVAALVVNESAGSAVPMDETLKTLARFAGQIPTAAIPRVGFGADGVVAIASLAKILA